MSMMQEIKRRRVFQVAAVYALVAWLIIQIIDVVNEPLNLPGWLDTVVIVLLAVGFPIAVILAWAFDITPEGIRSASEAPAPESRPASRAGLLGAVSQVLVLLAVAFLVADQYLFSVGAGPAFSKAVDTNSRQSVRFALELPSDEQLGVDDQSLSLAISPDGSRIVFSTLDGRNQYRWYVRSLDKLEPVPVRGTEVRFETPVFSPDGEWIAFNDLSQGTLVRVPVIGGRPVQIAGLATSAVRGATWGEDDTIVFGTQAAGLWQVAGAGGEVTRLTVPEGDTAHRWPAWLPGQEALLFTIISGQHGQIAVFEIDTGETRVIVAEGTSPRYLATGHIAYATPDGALRIAPFDPDTLTVTGQPVTVYEGIAIGAFGGAQYDIAGNGSLVSAEGPQLSASMLGDSPVVAVWVDEQGNEHPTGIDECYCIEPSISPDGTQLAVSMVAQTALTTDINIWSFERKMFVRLTFEDEPQRTPIWSPDSKRVAYRGLGQGIWIRAADGSGTPRLVMDEASVVPFAWLPEHGILFDKGPSGAVRQSFLLDPEAGAGSEAIRISSPDLAVNRPSVSPNGRWIAFENGRTGRAEVYVQPFPELDAGLWQVSANGGGEPRWSTDGAVLYYRNGDQLMAVSVEDSETFRFGRPEPLADLSSYLQNGATTYAVDPKSRRLLFLKFAGELFVDEAADASGKVIVVLNWFDEISRARP